MLGIRSDRVVHLMEGIMRHLAVGKDATTTLCGLKREGLTTVHPSKATREDCAECRAEARRKKKVQLSPPAEAVIEMTKEELLAPGAEPSPELVKALDDIKNIPVDPPAAEVKKVRNPNPSPRFRPTAEEVSRVKRLHKEGKTLVHIERAMGWPSGHGNRPWRILRNQLTAITEEFE